MVQFTYTVKAGDMGEFKILDICGETDNTRTEEDAEKTYGWVRDEHGNQNNIYSLTEEGVRETGTAIADTENPYITSIKVLADDKEIATYTKEKDKDAVITVGKTNTNIVEYVVTYNEKVPYSHFENISIENGIIRKIEYTNLVSLNEYKITVQTKFEGVQSLIIHDGTVEDKAGNIDGFVRLNAVTVDFTKPTVRFISEYNGGVYVLPTNIDKVEIRPNVEISEDIETIEYKWDDEEYVIIENYSASSDIAVPTKASTEAGTYVLHIRVVDLAGNVTETSKTYNVKNSKIYIVSSIDEYTKEPVTVTVKFKDGLTDNRKVTFKSEGSNELITLNAAGTDENGNTQYIITENGTVYAEATDRVGNKVFDEEKIENIDTEKPVVEIELNGANLVIGTGKDKATIKTNVETKDNNWVEVAKYAFLQEDLNPYSMTDEQKAKISNNLDMEAVAEVESTKSNPYYLYVIAKDKAGNETIVKSNPFTVVDTNPGEKTTIVEGENGPEETKEIIPAEKPVDTLIIFEQMEEDIKDRAYVNVNHDYSIIKELEISLEDENYGFIDEYNNVELYGNTTIKVKAWDACGNEVRHEYKVTDIVGPDFTISGNPEGWTDSDVELEIYSNSELKELTLNGENILGDNKYRVSKVITGYGEYTFKATDIYNNTSEQTIEVKIDKSAPEITDVKIENGEIV
ncbi:MAG: hypothetical protein IJ272_02865, partial [Clostridia bacterium]|nr:hypothetical protein [Clostridia bacterium]